MFGLNRKYRPPRTITPLIDPLAWFKYAGTCVLSEIHERNRKWTWAYFAERRDDRILSIAKAQLKKEKASITTAAASKAPATTTIGWISDWWSGAPEKAAGTAAEKQDAPSLTDDQVQQLMETIEYDPSTAMDEPDIPKEVVHAIKNFFPRRDGMKFEHNPLDERADEALYLGMLPLQVIYNPAAISAIVDFFTPPAAEAATVSTLKSVAQDTLQGLTAQTRAGIEFAIGTHKTIDVKIDMAAPIFVFPERYSCNTLNSMVVVVDAGHLLVESNLVDKGVKSDIERKQGSELTDSEFAKLESLLYDRFTCSLTSVQAIVGRSVDACLLQVKTGSDTGLHLLERVDVTFQLELCILPKIARYPRTRITGNLPRLHINLSDRKYKTIMRILDIVSGKTSQRQAQRSAQQMQAKALEWTFQKNSSDLVLDESDDSFFDAEESLVATSSLSEKAPADSPDRISLKFSFEVGQVSASLKKSGKDSDAVEQALANLKIDGFSLQFRQRPFDMNVRIRIHSISIENEAGSGSGGPQYLVAPTSSESTADQELLLIEYTSVNRASPNFTGTDQTVDISFASIDVLLVKDSILGLYDFVLITFTGPPTPKEDVVEVDAAEESTEVSPTPKQGGSGVMVVRAKMKSINFIIIQNQTSIATLSFGAGQLSLTLKDSGTSIAGRLGNLSIVDNVARVGGGRLFKQLLRIDGSEVADFTLDTFNKASENYPGYDTSLRLRTSSVKLTFIEPLMVELMAYFREFTQLHFLLESARRAAVEETAGKFHFDLHLETPVIEFPDTSLTSQDVLSMYLGRISASNSFLVDSDGDKNEIIADIKELKLVSSFGSNVEVKLMEDVASELNEIVLKLDQHQYFFILNMLGSVSRAFGGDTEVKDDDDGTIGAESEDELALSTHSRSVDSQVSMDVNVVIPSISLELEKNNKTFGEQESIARFSVLSLQLRAVTLADTTLEAQLHAHSLRITDTRPNTGNLFREIMAETTGDNDQLLLVLDHLFEIRNFFMQGNNADSNNQPSSPAKVSPQAVEVDRAEVNQLRVNLVGVEMILLHNALAEDTEAIILSAKELAYTSSVISTLSVSEMGMFFCVMTKREETTLRFIQNFDLTLVLDNRLTAPGHRMTNIYVDISPIMLRVSYRDVSLIRDVFNKVTELTSSDDKESKKVEEGVEQPAPSTIQDDIVMSREKIHVTTRGIRVLVIDDLNDVHLPMFNVAVDKLILEISDWSSTLRIDTGIKLHANYFNVKNSHWEPLVELFEVYLNVSRQEDAKMCIDVFSYIKAKRKTSGSIWSKLCQRVYVPRSNAHSPYILRNKTGYNMHVWAESLGDGLDTEVIDLQNDLEIPWRFDDWRAMREVNVSPSPNKLSILIDGRGWEPLKGIAVDREGVKTYILREDSKRADRVAHRLVCEVRLKNNRKIVTFRSSTVVHNGTSIPIELMVLSVNGQKQSRVYALGADEECAIPIEASFKDKILRRLGTTGALNFCIGKIFKSKEVGYPSLTLNIFDNDSRQEHRGSLKSGEIDPIHTVDPTHRLCLSIQVPDTDFQPNEPAFLNNGEDYRSLIATSRLAAGQGKVKQKVVFKLIRLSNQYRQTSLLCFRTRALSHCAAAPLSDLLTLSGANRNQEVHVGVTVKEGDGKYFLSKIVTFQPRFISKITWRDVFCRQSPSTPTSLVKAGDYIPIVYFSESDQRQLSLRLTGLMDECRMGSKSETFLELKSFLKEQLCLLLCLVKRAAGHLELIINRIRIFIWQKNSAARYLVNPKENRTYAWDNPSAMEKSLMKGKEPVKETVDNMVLQEILYASARKVDFIFRDTATTQDVSFRPGSLEPIFVYPTVLPKEGEELYHIMATLSKSKDSSYGVDYYNMFTILIQEISVDLDEDFLYALINFAKFDVSGWEVKERMYFEKFLFNRCSSTSLSSERTEAVGQLHKIIGSADFLGNPVGLFNNVSSGVHDFFYKPIEGFEISRPQDFGIGLAKGTTSLFKKTVYGVTDTLSKFTGSVSKGLSVITLDEEFQESRRLNSVRNRPRHAGHGVTAGATSLVTSVASGLHGVLSKPIEGAEKDGIGGFFKGLGKGLVGVVSKPLIGVFDLATNVSEGIRNTTTVFDKELEKIRLPRHIGKDGILAVPYDQREAQGSFWLRSINSGADEDYFAHLELNIEDLVVIVTDYRIIMIRWRSNRIDWEIPYKGKQDYFGLTNVI
ncbi:hypothetical protein BC829DRAFT_420941 [Chytridium lagenaria]|nr:hypothetical protein BC829DRAFT_420941 [Chytridium lagenaria]